MKHINIRIFGSVQGVSFRYYAREEARKLGLTGFVKNERDGSVHIEAEGEEEKLNELVDWCKRGPRSAEVEKVEVNEGDLKDFTHFNIVYEEETY